MKRNLLHRLRGHYRAFRYLGAPRWYAIVRALLEVL